MHHAIVSHVSRIIFALAVLAGCALAAGKDENWLTLTTPEFTLVTSLKEKEARAWAGEFSQFIATMRAFFADGERKLSPLTVVIFARERDFNAYRPLNADGTPQRVSGFFSRRSTWAVAGLSGDDDSPDLRRTIFHEGTHWFMSNAGRRIPPWLDEGVAEVFSTFEVRKGKAQFGEPIDNHVRALVEWDRPSLSWLLTARRDQMLSGSPKQTTLVYAESWALVHYLLFGENKISRQALGTYFKLAGRGRPAEDAFKQAFGRTVPEMEREFARYLDGGEYFVWRQPIVAVAPLAVTPTSPAELANALGRLALVSGHIDLAETQARAAIAAAPDAPEGRRLLASVLNYKNFAGGGRGPRRGGS